MHTRAKAVLGAGSMIQKHPHDAAHLRTDVTADFAEPVHKAVAVNRAQQLALDVARVIEAIRFVGFDLDVERKTSPCRRERRHDDEREVRTEDVRRPKDERRMAEGGFPGVWLAEIDQSKFVNRRHRRLRLPRLRSCTRPSHQGVGAALQARTAPAPQSEPFAEPRRRPPASQ